MFPTRRLRFVCEEPLKYGVNAAAQFDDPEWPRFVRITDITESGQLKDDTFSSLSPEVAEGYFLEEGDILLARSGSIGRSFIYGAEWGEACFAGYLVRARVSAEFDPRFVYWSLNALNFWSWIESIAIRSTIQNVSAERYAEYPVPAPPLDTQRKIARFLDDKTAQIDGLIGKKRELLDRLAEKRQALIARAVTKGLDHDASLKPSGIEWLGDIPVHWEVLPLRRITSRVATGRTPPSTTTDYFTDGNLNWFTPGDFSTAIELHNSARKVTLEAIENGVCTLFPERTVFLVGIGATLGKVAVSTTTGSANQQINAILPDRDNDPYFIAYFLHGYRTEVRVTSNGNTLGILNQDGTKSLLMPVPPLSEQKEIASELASHDARAAEIVQHIGGSIGLLQDYRAALITAGVTGQLAELR